jgi:aminoglycoside phosphotransferase (APT) family kinase protein
VVDLPGLRLDALRAWVRATGLGEQVDHAEVVAGGRSNLTYTLDLDGTRAVLRRPPLGHVLATAHDMTREHTVQAALHGVVPVPRMLALCEDPDVLGAPFYLMEHVDGVVVRTRAEVDALGDGGLAAAGDALVATLADLHHVDPDAVGLSAFGRPDGFLERQVRRWSGQLDASRSRELPEVDRLRDRLATSVPPASAAAHRRGVVHGDFRLDNAVFHPTGQGVRAVLDWEMATLGDPLADVGLLLTYSGALGGGPNPISEAMSPDLGWPTGSGIVRAYADRVGLDRDDLDALTWCTAFAHLKLAVICEGIHYRFTQGKTVGEGFDRIGALVTPLAARGLHLLDDPRSLED